MATAHRSYLLLGEGDFTYSLDACRYLASSSLDGSDAAAAPASAAAAAHPSAPAPSPSTARSTAVPSSVSITCTGVDTLEELRGKYKDIDFVLRGIRSCGPKSNGSDASRWGVDVAIVHGVNAVQAECTDGCGENLRQSFDHVEFNHPHLGTEDARLHSRFLHHFFHAATKRWMQPPTGLLHLALVKGQCERWKCIEAAKKHGLILLRRGTFRPPPPPKGEKDTYYELRRHQSGRSFASRRRMQGGESLDGCGQNDSETVVFGRESYYSKIISANDSNATVGLLPWESGNKTAASKSRTDFNEGGSTATPTAESFVGSGDALRCKHCSKSFEQHRSLKNHMMCSHPDCDEVRAWKLEKGKKKKNRKRKMNDDECTQQSTADDANAASDGNETDGPPWICNICNPPEGDARASSARTFPHRQALLDHKRAKHFGNHLDIKPDWYRGDGSEEKDATIENAAAFGTCPICDWSYATQEDKLRHEMEFVPSPSLAPDESSDTNGSSYECRHCSKSFRERRAQRQHENFCSAAKQTVQ